MQIFINEIYFTILLKKKVSRKQIATQEYEFAMTDLEGNTPLDLCSKKREREHPLALSYEEGEIEKFPLLRTVCKKGEREHPLPPLTICVQKRRREEHPPAPSYEEGEMEWRG